MADSGSRRRSPAEWLVRIGGAVAVCPLVFVLVTQSIALVLVERDPATAHLLAPNLALVTGENARRALVAHPDTGQSEAERLANAALAGEPTSVAVAATLGLVAQLRGQVPTARRWFGYAERLSRRDLSTELWLIENAVNRGDIKGALRHYDITLRTQWGAGEILFPLLAAGSHDRSIATELETVLAAKPEWSDEFLNYLAGNTADPEAAVRLFTALRARGGAVPGSASNGLVNLLLNKGRHDLAWQYYATIRPGVDRRRSRDPDFSATIEQPSQLDWLVSSDPGLTAVIQGGADRGVFSFSAAPTLGGALLQQVQLLPPGHYVLEGQSSDIDQPLGERPLWILKCGDGRELGRIALPNSAERGGRFSGTFVVPPGCSNQLLTLIAQPVSGATGLNGNIVRVQLRPAS